MSAFVALLRAVNVGGTGKLPMLEMQAICKKLGFRKIRTYIASGNVVFESDLSEMKVKNALEVKLASYAGKPVGVVVRTAEEMRSVVAKNPFPHGAPNRTVAVFLDESPPADAMDLATGKIDEKLGLGSREIYIQYGQNMARSKLKIPCAKTGTARNMNTVARLAQMASEL